MPISIDFADAYNFSRALYKLFVTVAEAKFFLFMVTLKVIPTCIESEKSQLNDKSSLN
jgi:hypothetical protein